MIVLGLKIRGHDTGAAIIADGKIVAIAEERLNRVKHSFDMFPELSIPYCLGALNIKAEDIDIIVIDQVSARWRVDMKKYFYEKVGGMFPRARVEVINHHDAHAASAFFCSPFESAAVLVHDGSGEIYKSHLGVAAIESDTLYRGAGTRLFSIQKTLHLRDGKWNPYTQGIGKLYSEITYYLNLGKYNEGKTMGLAPYGTDVLLRQFPPEMWYREVNGHLLCNARLFYPRGSLTKRVTRKRKSVVEFIDVARSFLRMGMKRIIRPRIFRWLDKYYSKDMFMEPTIFPELRLPRPPRTNEQLPDEYYSSVAYAVQKVFETVACKKAELLKNITGAENLCVAGGCGLNIDSNAKFLFDVGYKNVFIQPGASDTGIALGCALWGWHVVLNKPRYWVMKSADLGRTYSEAEIREALNSAGSKIVFRKSADVAKETAQFIADGTIVGWFYGGAEYGPRSLGNRSILCDARHPDMRDIANNKVKHREPWRPFAASVLNEHAREWFELECESPFMLLAANVKKDKRGKIPSVTHVDGTCRIQTVTKKENGRYYDCISEFNKLTGVPLVLDTSFNLAGEPIVETPDDALKTFLATKMDYLILEEYIVTKRSSEPLN